MWSYKGIILVLVVVLGFGAVCALAGGGKGTAEEGRAKALELLDKFAEKREKVISFIVSTEKEAKFEAKSKLLKGPMYNKSGTIYTKCEYRCDATRGKESFYLWGDVELNKPEVPEEQAHYTSNLWDGEDLYLYNRISPPHPGSLTVMRGKDPGGLPKGVSHGARGNNIVGEMMGYHWGDNGKRVDEILAQAKNLKLRQEKLRGVDCYVIDAVVRGKGKYTVWIDPIHDYHIAKIHVQRKVHDKAAMKRLKKNDYTNEIYEISRFQQIENLWFPEEYKVKFASYHAETGTSSMNDRVINLTNIILNPDHDALRSFMPDDIPNGISVRIPAIETGYYSGGPQCKWVRGARYVVGDKGRVVSNDLSEGLPPVVKVLPPLKKFEIKINPRRIKDKMVFMCFIDIKQRASQECAAELKGQEESLAEKGVVVVLVQASEIEAEELDRWERKNNIRFALGRLREKRVKKLLRAWGAKRLPWLILADREHVVTAEGFGLDELEKKIKEACDVEL